MSTYTVFQQYRHAHSRIFHRVNNFISFLISSNHGALFIGTSAVKFINTFTSTQSDGSGAGGLPGNCYLLRDHVHGLLRSTTAASHTRIHNFKLHVFSLRTLSSHFSARILPAASKYHSIMSLNEYSSSGSECAQYSSTTHTGSGTSEANIYLMNDARDIFGQAVDSVLPHNLIRHKLMLLQNDTLLKVGDVEYFLQNNVYVVGFGKAVIGMARVVDDLIGKHIVRGVISVPVGIQDTFRAQGKVNMLMRAESCITVMEGAPGNLPDEAAHQAAVEIIKIAEEVKEGDILIVLISGGGSALLPSPKPPVTLENMLALTRLMSKSGANIIQLNTVRKEIEILKGGGLAKLAQPARVISLILSDVIGDPLDFIAGGPTVKNTSSLEDSLRVLEELNISKAIPATVSQMPNQECHNAPGQDIDAVDWSRVQNVLVGSNQSACEAACARSAALGYSPFLLSTQVEGDAQVLGRMYINLARYISIGLQGSKQKDEARDLENILAGEFKIHVEKLRQLQKLAQDTAVSDKKGICVVAGGETTVVVKGRGIGGRNQEMAVAAAVELDAQTSAYASATKCALTQTNVVFSAAGTDGIDGPNSAAGGVISAEFAARAAASALDVTDFLNRNDTYTLLSKVDNGLYHIVTGQTGTNVMDIHVLLVTG